MTEQIEESNMISPKFDDDDSTGKKNAFESYDIMKSQMNDMMKEMGGDDGCDEPED